MNQDGTLPFGVDFCRGSQNVRALSFIALILSGECKSLTAWLDGFGIGVNFFHVLSEDSLCPLPVDLVLMVC